MERHSQQLLLPTSICSKFLSHAIDWGSGFVVDFKGECGPHVELEIWVERDKSEWSAQWEEGINEEEAKEEEGIAEQRGTECVAVVSDFRK